MKRFYLLGLSYIAFSAIVIARSKPPQSVVVPPPRPVRPAPAPAPAPMPSTDAAGWFISIKPFCNTVEVETALERNRPPAGARGTGYEAACLALAGKVDRARELITSLEEQERAGAAGIVFEIAHPVADAGDDKSAGPIMAMVVEFSPTHYMALYHAGISEYALGDFARARPHLEAFMRYYSPEDGWRSSARAALEKMAK